MEWILRKKTDAKFLHQYLKERRVLLVYCSALNY
jgi:hypothetical protein